MTHRDKRPLETSSIRAVALVALVVLSVFTVGVSPVTAGTTDHAGDTIETSSTPGDGVVSSDWPTDGHDPTQAGSNQNSSGPRTSPDARWIYEFSNDDSSVPTVVSDGLAFIAGYGTLRAVDSKTGEAVWNVTTPDNYDDISAADGVVLTTESGYSGEIRAYHATNGTEIWNVTSAGADASVVLDGALYVTLGDYLYAFDLRTGTQLWYDRTDDDVSIGLAAAGDTIYATGYVNDRDYAVYALNVSSNASATERWRFEMEGPVSMPPVVVDGAVYVGAGSEPRDQTSGVYDPKFYRLNATDGHVEWVFDVNTRPHGVAVADGFVYLASGNTIHGLDGATGEREWIHRLAGSLDYGLDYTRIDSLPPAVANGTVYATNDRGHLVALDGTDGTELWSYRLEGEPTRPAVADDSVYVHVTDTEDYDDLTRVYALEEPPIRFSGFSLSKTAVAPGEQFTADVTIENVDDETRTYNLSLLADPPLPVDRLALDRSNGTLGSGQSATLTFSGQLDTAGSWNVSVERLLETDAAVDPVPIEVVHATRDDGWPQTDFDGARTKHNPDTLGPKQHLQEIWNLSNFDSYLEPVIANGSVYAVHDRNANGEYADLVKAYDEATGAFRWGFNVSTRDRRLAGSPVLYNDTVYLYATPSNYDNTGPRVVDASVFALDARNGSVEWTYDTTLNYSSLSNDQEPVVANGTVYVAGGRVDETDDVNASVLAIDAASGSTKWRYDVNEAGTDETFRSVSVDNGTVVATLSDRGRSDTPDYDGLVAIDAAAGTHMWSSSGLTLDMVEPPVVRDGLVYVVNETKNGAGESAETLFALNVSDGGVNWEFVPYDVSSVADDWRVYSPAVTDDAVYVRQMMLDTYPFRTELYRLDPATGAITWNRSVPAFLDVMAVDGLIYVGDSAGSRNDGYRTFIYDAATGERYGRTTAAGRALGSVKAVANGTMILFADSTRGYDFRVVREGGIIEYTDLSVDSHVVGVDQNVTVTATATNIGSHAREYDVNLQPSPQGGYNEYYYIRNGVNQEGLLQPGRSTTVTWEVELRVRGDFVFTLRPVSDGTSMGRHMYDRAGSATVHAGDADDGQVFDLGNPRDLAPDTHTWPKTSYDAGNTGNASGNSAPTAVVSDPVNWSVNHSSEWTSGPTLANDTVFVGGSTDSGAEAVFAYDAADGSLRWQYATSNDVEVPPVYAGGYLYVIESYGRVYQLNATTGERLWTFTAGDDSGLTVVDGVVYVAGETASEDRLYALNATTREILWTYSKVDTGYGMTTPAVENGTVYLTHDGQGTYAVDASMGVEEWSRPIAGSGSRLHSPVVAGGVVYVDDATYSSTNANVYALDATDGTTIWSTPANVDGYTGSSPALADDTLYFTADGAVRAVNASNGNDRWSTTVCAGTEHAPVYAGGTVFIPLDDSTIRAYNASTGDLVWRYDAYYGESFAPAVVDGILYSAGLEYDVSGDPYPLLALTGGQTGQESPVFRYSGFGVSSTNVSTGEQLTVSATVENTGSSSCSYTAAFQVDGSLDDTATATVSGEYTDTVSFTHTFGTVGTHNVTIADLPPVDITVTGSEPDIDVSPSARDFGNVTVGNDTDRYVSVSNVGTETLYVFDTSITGPDPTGFTVLSVSQTTIHPGDTATVRIRYEPVASGSSTATFEIGTNDPDEATATATLTGTGVGSPEVDVFPESVSFGDVNVGANVTTIVTVSNLGDSDLWFDGAQLTGSDAAVYHLIGGSGTTTIAAGDAHNVTVRFEPTTTGPTSATLELSTDDADESTVSVALSGNGTDPAPTPTPTATNTPTETAPTQPTETTSTQPTTTPTRTVQPTDSPSPSDAPRSTTDADTPGFGIIVAIIGILTAALLAARRER
jgi:PGF-CTERM protein